MTCKYCNEWVVKLVKCEVCGENECQYCIEDEGQCGRCLANRLE